MTNVQNAIEKAAARFAYEVIGILRQATLAELLMLAGKDAALIGANGVSHLDGAGASRGRTAGRRAHAEVVLGHDHLRRARRGRGTGRKRSPDEVNHLAERALQWLQTNKGDWAVSAIAGGLKLPVTDLGLPLQRLRKDGRVKVFGQKRSTVYRLV